jgi:DNA-binding Xre family transcriptional regulator
MKIKPKSIGSSFDDFLKEEGIYEQVTAAAIKRVITDQMEEAMAEKRVSRTEMAKRMNTSRPSLQRLLDPKNDSVTLNTLFKAATAIGRHVRVELI